MELDQNEGLWLEGWHRHMILAMLSDAYLAVNSHRAAELGALCERKGEWAGMRSLSL